VDAVSLGCACDHIFCRLCLDRALDLRASCPTCRELKPTKKVKAANLVNLRINSVVVRCERRCGWHGRYDQRRAHGKVCPVAKDTEFAAALSGHLGLNLELIDGTHLVVAWLEPEGAAAAYNERLKACPAKQIQPGCAIIECNGLRGDAHELMYCVSKVVTNTGVHRLVFSQPIEFRATVVRNEKPLGLELGFHDKHIPFLLIWSVIPGGAVMEYNSHNEEKVKSYDRIVEVNGFRGPSMELLEQLKVSDPCELKICRLGMLPPDAH